MKDLNENVSRRAVLKIMTSSTLASLAAFQFGSVINSAQAADIKLVLLYATKYGATRDTARWIGEGLGRPVDIVNIKEISGIKNYKHSNIKFILGCAVFKEGPMKEMLQFVQKHVAVLNGQVAATYIVCGTPANNAKNKQRIAAYLAQLNNLLPQPPDLSRHFGGRLIVSKLTAEDREALMRFYAKVAKKSLQDWDRTDPVLAKNFAQQMQTLISS